MTRRKKPPNEPDDTTSVIIVLVIVCVLMLIFAITCMYPHIYSHVNTQLDNQVYTPDIFTNGRYVCGNLSNFKLSKVVFCGLIRDNEAQIPYIRKQLCDWGDKYFQDYHIIIVENDSKDGTRQKLLEWQREDPKRIHILGCGLNRLECKLNLDKTIEHVANVKRIKKMAYLRNLYLDYLYANNHLFADVNYVIVTDLDLKGSIYEDGFASTSLQFEQNPHISAISANGITQQPIPIPILGMELDMFYYYDTYAHEEHTQTSINYISSLINTTFFTYGDAIVPVRSAFSGFTTYRYDVLRNIRYKTYIEQCDENILSLNGTTICEHVGLNRQLGDVYLNPSMMFIITDNPN
jgi:glycosyltransferase involved in cell wall biosynthesis